MKFAKTPALHNLCTLSSTSLVFAEEHEKRVEVVKVQKIASYQPRIFRIFVFFGTHTEANNNQNCLIFNLKVKQMWAQFGINCHMYEPKLAKWDFLSEFQTLWCNRVFKGSTSRIALKARKSNYVVEQGEGSWIILGGVRQISDVWWMRAEREKNLFCRFVLPISCWCLNYQNAHLQNWLKASKVQVKQVLIEAKTAFHLAINHKSPKRMEKRSVKNTELIINQKQAEWFTNLFWRPQGPLALEKTMSTFLPNLLLYVHYVN